MGFWVSPSVSTRDNNQNEIISNYMSAHVLLNLSNKLGKGDKLPGLTSMLLLFATNLINSMIQEHRC